MKNIKNVQLYMNIYDLKPHEPLWERITDKHDPPEDWDKEDLIADIQKQGFKYAINADPDGNIRNGNARYWVARMLFEQGDERFRYLPVQRSYAAGMHNSMFKATISKELTKPLEGETPEDTHKRTHAMGNAAIDKITLKLFKEFMNTKDLVIVPAIAFDDYPIDPENEVFLLRHWEQSSGEYTSFVIQHPKEEKMVFALILEGHRTYAELLEDERIKESISGLRQEYADGKDEWRQRQLLARIKRKEKQS